MWGHLAAPPLRQFLNCVKNQSLFSEAFNSKPDGGPVEPVRSIPEAWIIVIVSVSREHLEWQRIIGKNNSMLDVVKKATDTTIFVGRNGRIFIANGDISKAIEAIKKIEKEAHKKGLTDEMTKFLGEKK